MNECASSRLRHAWDSRSLLAPAVALSMGLLCTSSVAANIFFIDGRRPTELIVTVDEQWDWASIPDTSMGRTVAGVLAAHVDDRSIVRFIRCATDKAVAIDVGEWVPQCSIHVRNAAGASRRIDLLAGAGGAVAAHDAESQITRAIDPARFKALSEEWSPYRGSFDDADVVYPRGSSVELHRPYAPGSFTMNVATMKQRVYRRINVQVSDADRAFDEETLHVRLPADYDPHQRAGLLLWSSPTPNGWIPTVFEDALDELNIVCVGIDNAGNERDVPDKFQLLFDAVSTARRQFNIDDRRVYITGMSGGAKVSSIMAICFPDVFCGSIPIVGVGTHHSISDQWERHRYAYCSKPRGELLTLARSRRMAMVGGPPDFNYDEMRERQRLLEGDGFGNIRFFSYEDMGHVMPTSPRFAEALRWIDEPYSVGESERQEQARQSLETYRVQRESPEERLTGADRQTLIDIVDSFPWTPGAWQALAILDDAGGG